MSLPSHMLSEHDMSRLEKAGVKTVYSNLYWFNVEKHMGERDWSYYDDFVLSARNAGLKVMMTPCEPPSFLPDDWYSRNERGRIWNEFPTWCHLSPWHTEAQSYQDVFYVEARDHYNAQDVMIVAGSAHGGEALLPYDLAYYDPSALASWYNFIGKQELPPKPIHATPERTPELMNWLKVTLVEQYVHHKKIFDTHPSREAWTALHHCWENHLQSGNQFIADVVQRVKDDVAPDHYSAICFGYWWIGGPLAARARSYMEMGLPLWVGSEYAAGLPRYTKVAIEQGLRGFITRPWAYEDNGNLTDDLVRQYANSIQSWREARVG